MSQIKEDYISFETAELAKEKGFPQHFNWNDPVLNAYHSSGLSWGLSSQTEEYKEENLIYKSRQTQLQKWLREEHRIHITVTDLGISLWSTLITELMDGGTKSIGGKLGKENFKNYEEALENGLQEALKLINND